jgi:AraC family transcriptional regulator
VAGTAKPLRVKTEVTVTAPATTPYEARLRKALKHIEEHLDEDLSVEVLSGIAAFSQYHFHRQFSALFGINVHRYVQLARLKRASYKLAFRSEEPILQIALDIGYEGPEAFARAFKKAFGQTPSEFRNLPQWTSWHAIYQPISETRKTHMARTWTTEDVRIETNGDIRVAVLEHRGAPTLIGASVQRFIAWRKEHGIPKSSPVFNILYDDPRIAPAAEFRLDICVATEQDVAPNSREIRVKTIPGGRCAMLRHVGSEENLGAAIFYLYGVWLPQSGEEPRDFPLYCQRIRFFPDVPEHEAVTDIYLPLN